MIRPFYSPHVRQDFRSARYFAVGVAILAVSCGCGSDEMQRGGAAAPPAPGATAPPAPGAGAPPAPGAVTTQPAGAPAGATDGIPPELVSKVEELIRLTGEYNALAVKVQDVETFKQHRDELSAIDGKLSSLVDDVMIAQAKLSPQQSAQFDRQFYDTRAKPLVDEKRQHQQRITLLVP